MAGGTTERENERGGLASPGRGTKKSLSQFPENTIMAELTKSTRKTLMRLLNFSLEVTEEITPASSLLPG